MFRIFQKSRYYKFVVIYYLSPSLQVIEIQRNMLHIKIIESDYKYFQIEEIYFSNF